MQRRLAGLPVILLANALAIVMAIVLTACGAAHEGPREPTGSAAVAQASAPPAPPAPTTPTPLIAPSPDFDIVDLILDDQRVYWAHRGERGLVSVPLASGPLSTLAPATTEPIISVAADATHLYWTGGRREGGQESEAMLGRVAPRMAHYVGYVARINKDGSGKQELTSGRFVPSNVAVDGGTLYWVMVRPREGTLVRLPAGADSPTVVAHGHFAPQSLIVHGGRAYWIDPEAGPAVMLVSLAGEEPKKLAQGEASNPVHPIRLAADDQAVYWTDGGSSPNGGAVVKVPVGEGGASLLAIGLQSPRGIAVHGGFVYWAEKGSSEKNFHDGSIRKAPTTGGKPIVLASDLLAPDHLAVSDSRVVWNELDGSVKTMAR
jgi:hypothetical protein